MKELSIEEKAKYYDEALKVIKECIPDENGFITIYPQEIFLELKESEDERIRGAIIDHLKDNNLIEWAAWLEKQGEQKPAGKVEPKFKAGDRVIGIVSGTQYYITEVCDDYYYTESGCTIMFYSQDNFELYKQKPTWSDEDEIGLVDALWAIQQARTIAKDENDMGNIWYAENWLKSLKDRVQPQPQSHWKPSEEQLNVLDSAIYTYRNSANVTILKTLREQLKAL